MISKINPRLLTALIIIVVAGFTRFLPFTSGSDLFNINPLGAMALFGGAYFAQRWKAILFPLATLFISDIILNTIFYKGEFGIMYSGWYWIYVSFIVIVLMGNYLLRTVSVKNVLLASLLAAVAHWLISDIGIFIAGTDITTGKPFEHTFAGLVKCYTLALPFMKSFLTGTLFFNLIMFGSFELAKKKVPALATE